MHVHHVYPLMLAIFLLFSPVSLTLAAHAPAVSASTQQWLDKLTDIQRRTQADPEGSAKALAEMESQLPADEPLVQQKWQQLRCTVGAANSNTEQVQQAAEWLMRESATKPELGIIANTCRASLLFRVGDRQQAFQLAQQAVQQAKQQTDWRLRFDAALQLGQIADRLGEFDTALEAYLQAQSAAEAMDDRHALFLLWGNLSVLYTYMNRLDEAIATNDRALQLAEAEQPPDANRLTRLYLQRYFALSRTDRLDDRQHALLQAERYAAQTPEPQLKTITAVNLSDHYYKTGQYEKSIASASKAIQLAEQYQDPALRAIGFANRGFAKLYAKQDGGRQDVEQSIKMLGDMGNKPDVSGIYQEYSEVLAAIGDYREAYLAAREHKRLSDELFRADRDKRVLELQEQYNTEKREREITLLSKENALKSVELANRELERRTWWLVAVITALVLCALVLLYRRARTRVTQLSAINIDLDYQSTHDPLTGLFNRRYVDHFFRQFDWQAPLQPGHTHALFLLDLDHFKQINDRLGHAAGDVVLKTIADRLRSTLRERDIAVRWGGEEFLIVLLDVQREQLEAVAQRLMQTVAGEPVTLEQGPLPVTGSFGYAVLPLRIGEQALSIDKTLHLVDLALYQAKARGRNQAVGITALQLSSEHDLETLETGLADAIAAGQIEARISKGPGG
ncbi:tetratricopeptide repeat-containing diguanylate cyclase [Permianibacter aggregans]|uniref:diguanylate cyclase n=1 Tax=Permianibacter aggregans TaxID=1510150 RepID=A0A4R6UQC0_9GAMM|nr:tetratricopeptide repeat-containing diguanylate cyclase [Permianibacter aggregans]QGX39089.1 diguanylate cyclase [Permianibacter aggregans]TDQ47703.1 diguanylate cyclase (GGDEF)-like protein [Permianibacter aggregans]